MTPWYSEYLPQVALCFLVPAIILCVVFPLDPLSGILLLVSAPLIPIFMALIGGLSSALTRRQWDTLSHMSAHFLDVLQGITTLKLFGRSRRQTAVIARISDDFRRATMRVLRVAFLSALVLELVATISTAMVAVEIGVRLLGGGISFGRAFFILILAPEFYLPLRTLGARYHAAMSGKAAFKRICEVLDTPAPTLAIPNDASRVPDAPLTLTFRDVDFSYAASSRPALDGASFNVPAGKTVALVGPSGAGKSTVVSLLLRFLEPQSGAVEVNGMPVSQLDPAAWRERIAWVPQRPYLFAASVAENIRLGRATATDEEVRTAARLAQAHEFIDALPQGYETPLGERGMRLSGGQAQRIALARAFLRAAPLLLLDEPTSQLDAESEDALRVAFAELASDRTTLVIAHRLSTIYRADAIVVLDAGRVVDSGTHATLLKTCPVYRGLVSAAEGVATWTL